MGPKVAFVENAVYTIGPEDILVTDEGTGITIAHRNVSVTASSTKTLYLAVHCMGHFSPLSSGAVSLDLSPAVVDPAFHLRREVARVTVHQPINNTVMEGMPLATQPRVCVTDAAGRPLPGKRAVAKILAQFGEDPASPPRILPPFLPRRPDHPAWAARSIDLIHPVSPPTGADGCATFEGLGFSTGPGKGRCVLAGGGRAAGGPALRTASPPAPRPVPCTASQRGEGEGSTSLPPPLPHAHTWFCGGMWASGSRPSGFERDLNGPGRDTLGVPLASPVPLAPAPLSSCVPASPISFEEGGGPGSPASTVSRSETQPDTRSGTYLRKR